MDEITQLKEKIEILEKLLFAFIKSDKYYFGKHIVLADGLNISLSSGTGTKIGTATGQKLGFWNVTPVDQPATVSDPSGGTTIDAEARTAINTIIDRLQESGMIT